MKTQLTAEEFKEMNKNGELEDDHSLEIMTQYSITRLELENIVSDAVTIGLSFEMMKHNEMEAKSLPKSPHDLFEYAKSELLQKYQ